MAKKDTPKRPADLGTGGVALWSAVTGDYDLRADELRTLEDACREADLIDAMQRTLDSSDLVIAGSMGQDRIHPLVSEIRQHRAVLKTLMQALKLPDDVKGEGEGTGERSSAARAAAQARWSRRGA